MLDEFAFSCGTPSMNVVTAGLFGLEPMPRKRALLSLRAVNSLKNVFGAYCAASLTLRTPALSSVSRVTAVTLTGASWMFSGSFSALTVTVGSRKRIVPSSSCVAAPGAWADGFCAIAAAGSSRARARRRRFGR